MDWLPLDPVYLDTESRVAVGTHQEGEDEPPRRSEP